MSALFQKKKKKKSRDLTWTGPLVLLFRHNLQICPSLKLGDWPLVAWRMLRNGWSCSRSEADSLRVDPKQMCRYVKQVNVSWSPSAANCNCTPSAVVTRMVTRLLGLSASDCWILDLADDFDSAPASTWSTWHWTKDVCGIDSATSDHLAAGSTLWSSVDRLFGCFESAGLGWASSLPLIVASSAGVSSGPTSSSSSSLAITKKKNGKKKRGNIEELSALLPHLTLGIVVNTASVGYLKLSIQVQSSAAWCPSFQIRIQHIKIRQTETDTRSADLKLRWDAFKLSRRLCFKWAAKLRT